MAAAPTEAAPTAVAPTAAVLCEDAAAYARTVLDSAANVCVAPRQAMLSDAPTAPRRPPRLPSSEPPKGGRISESRRPVAPAVAGARAAAALSVGPARPPTPATVMKPSVGDAGVANSEAEDAVHHILEASEAEFDLMDAGAGAPADARGRDARGRRPSGPAARQAVPLQPPRPDSPPRSVRASGRGALSLPLTRTLSFAPDTSPTIPREVVAVGSGADGVASPYPTEHLPRVGDLVGEHYRLVRLLGTGMFGRVFVAERTDVPAHHVALKVIPREVYSGRNVERELVMLAAASHPNIVQLKDHGATDHYVWLTMPVYQGETLADRLRRRLLTLREAYEIFLPVARALDALHEAGLRHQDIKPENIFLAVFGGRLHPVLLDLGVAAERDASFVAGTVLYASPEQLSAFSTSVQVLPLTDRMDTYCLASTLLVSIVGPEHYPGEGAQTHEDMAYAQWLRAQHPLAYGALPDLRGRPRAMLEEAFRRWLALEPDRRSKVADMADDLDVLLEPEREEDRVALARMTRQRRVRRATLYGVLGLSMLGGVVAYSKRELLLLAGELSRVRAQGAQSFDKLDTCVASHRLARAETESCRQQRAADLSAYQTAIAQAGKGASGSAAERSHAVVVASEGVCSAKLRSCEELVAVKESSYRIVEDRWRACAKGDEPRGAQPLSDPAAGSVETLGAEPVVGASVAGPAIAPAPSPLAPFPTSRTAAARTVPKANVNVPPLALPEPPPADPEPSLPAAAPVAE